MKNKKRFNLSLNIVLILYIVVIAADLILAFSGPGKRSINSLLPAHLALLLSLYLIRTARLKAQRKAGEDTCV